MNVGVVRETEVRERRVAIVPADVSSLAEAGLRVSVEASAGVAAGYPDAAYTEQGATIVADRRALFENSDVLCQVRTPAANTTAGDDDRSLMRFEQVVIGFAEPLTVAPPNQAVAATGVNLFAMELMPRITRAQSMDALSSQATVQGYKSVILAAGMLPKMFPMMMTAAGTLRAASIFVIGAGVAGLGAIATSRRLGAVVRAFDIRPAVKEQVESLGATFLESTLETAGAEDKGGYAKAMDDRFYRNQQEMMAEAVADSDVIICTAAVPGKTAPTLVTAEMVDRMHTASIIVDLAAERGGNCELSRPDETVTHTNGVTIVGPTNLPATVPFHASQMYSRNVSTFLLHIVEDGRIDLDRDDEILQQTLLTRGGRIVHARVCDLLNLSDEPAVGESAVGAPSDASREVDPAADTATGVVTKPDGSGDA